MLLSFQGSLESQDKSDGLDWHMQPLIMHFIMNAAMIFGAHTKWLPPVWCAPGDLQGLLGFVLEWQPAMPLLQENNLGYFCSPLLGVHGVRQRAAISVKTLSTWYVAGAIDGVTEDKKGSDHDQQCLHNRCTHVENFIHLVLAPALVRGSYSGVDLFLRPFAARKCALADILRA